MLSARFCTKYFAYFILQLKYCSLSLLTEKGAEKQGIEVICPSHRLVSGESFLATALSPCVTVPPAGWLRKSKTTNGGCYPESRKGKFPCGVSMCMWVWSLALLSGSGIWCCQKLWCRSNIQQLQLWFNPPAWELPYAVGVALKKKAEGNQYLSSAANVLTTLTLNSHNSRVGGRKGIILFTVQMRKLSLREFNGLATK